MLFRRRSRPESGDRGEVRHADDRDAERRAIEEGLGKVGRGSLRSYRRLSFFTRSFVADSSSIPEQKHWWRLSCQTPDQQASDRWTSNQRPASTHRYSDAKTPKDTCHALRVWYPWPRAPKPCSGPLRMPCRQPLPRGWVQLQPRLSRYRAPKRRIHEPLLRL